MLHVQPGERRPCYSPERHSPIATRQRARSVNGGRQPERNIQPLHWWISGRSHKEMMTNLTADIDPHLQIYAAEEQEELQEEVREVLREEEAQDPQMEVEKREKEERREVKEQEDMEAVLEEQAAPP